MKILRDRDRERQRETETERQTERQREIQRDRETERQIQREIQRDIEAERQIQREIQRDGETEREFDHTISYTWVYFCLLNSVKTVSLASLVRFSHRVVRQMFEIKKDLSHWDNHDNRNLLPPLHVSRSGSLSGLRPRRSCKAVGTVWGMGGGGKKFCAAKARQSCANFFISHLNIKRVQFGLLVGLYLRFPKATQLSFHFILIYIHFLYVTIFKLLIFFGWQNIGGGIIAPPPCSYGQKTPLHGYSLSNITESVLIVYIECFK